MEVDFCMSKNKLEKNIALLNFNPKFKKFDICKKWKWNLNGTYAEDNPNTFEVVIIDEVSINIRSNSIDSTYVIVGLKKTSGAWVHDDFLEFIKEATEEDLKDFY